MKKIWKNSVQYQRNRFANTDVGFHWVTTRKYVAFVERYYAVIKVILLAQFSPAKEFPDY